MIPEFYIPDICVIFSAITLKYTKHRSRLYTTIKWTDIHLPHYIEV